MSVRIIGDQDIENPVDKVSLQFGIAMSETPIGDRDVVMRIVVTWTKNLARMG
jgi:hypothetical protein